MSINMRKEGALKKMILVGLGVIMITVISGCSDNNMNTTNNTDVKDNNQTSTNEVLQTDFSSKAAVALQPIGGGTVTGESAITYNEETKVMSVEVEVTGLDPDSEHVQHIHVGTCEEPGEAIHPLDNLKANADGEASTTNTFQDVEQFDVANMVLNIHQGADLEGDNAKQISCGIVVASE